MIKRPIYALIILTFSATPSLASEELSAHQLLVSCNKEASSLVESFDSELKTLKESRRLDLLTLVSDGCQGGYRAARDGMQYKDLERYLLKQDSEGIELPVMLIVSSVKRGYEMYSNPVKN